MLKVNKAKRGINKRRFKDGITGFLFTTPFLIGFILFILSPFVMYVVMSFSTLKLNDQGIMVFHNVKFSNYIDILFKQGSFFKELIGNFSDFAIQCPAVLLLSLFLAILLNQRFKGRTIARAVFFLPVLITSGAPAMFSNDALSVDYFRMLSSGEDGTVDLVQAIITVLGGADDSPLIEIVSYLMDKMYLVISASGVQILIFLAGLLSISPQLYEAAAVEGCTAWESFWKITLPMISPMILVNAVYTVIDNLGNSKNTIINKMYTLAMTNGNYGLSAAMGLVYFIIIFAILGIVFTVLNRFVFYEENL